MQMFTGAVLDGLLVVTWGSIIFGSDTRGTFGLVVIGVSATRLLPAAEALKLNRIVFSSAMARTGNWYSSKSGCDVLCILHVCFTPLPETHMVTFPTSQSRHHEFNLDHRPTDSLVVATPRRLQVSETALIAVQDQHPCVARVAAQVP